MARTYPHTVSYNECLERKANPLSFVSLRLIDLRNGHSQYLSTIEQLVDALLKSMDHASCFALQGHIAHPWKDSPSLFHESSNMVFVAL